MKLLRGILLPTLLLAAIDAVAAADGPEVHITKFDTPPTNLFYFDDTETVLVQEPERGVVWRSKDGGKNWAKIDQFDDIVGVIRNPYDNKVAIALGRHKKHWITYNQAEDWRSFQTDGPPIPDWLGTVSFHATDNKKILFHGDNECLDIMGRNCYGQTWYTTDGFESIKDLRDMRKNCIWAKSHDLFTSEDKNIDENRIVCIVKGRYSAHPSDTRLVRSDDYFKTEDEPVMSSGRTVQGMANIAPVKAWIVAAAKSKGTDELALYVTKDTITWHRAEFGDHKVEEDGYTVLESTNYSVQVDVMTSKEITMGALFTSNSNGTYFTRNIDHTNRDRMGWVDFEKVSSIQGIILVNIVDNYEELNTPWAMKKVKSKISFDDGRTFESIKDKDGKEIHFHSVTQLKNSGRVFSSPAPGLIMGVGNTGSNLAPYDEGDLYISDDAGLTWRKALSEAHKFEFGDQGAVLVAVYDESETDKIMYTLDHWHTSKEIPLEEKVRARELTTLPDSTSLQFIMVATTGRGSNRKDVIVSLDFHAVHERKCKNDDFEEFKARDGKCIMGRKQIYRRRKAKADCFVDEEFKDPEPTWETCACTKEDYECDYNFEPSMDGDDKKCEPAKTLKAPDGKCKDGEEEYEGSSGWRLIPGNKCDKNAKNAVVLDAPTMRKCEETITKPSSGKISQTWNFFTSRFRRFYYLERAEGSNGDDETVIMLTEDNVAYISHDHGKNWNDIVDDPVIEIYPHQYNRDHVYLVTDSDKIYYSKNRGLDDFHDFKAPLPPNKQGLHILSFHPDPNLHDWLIYTGFKSDKEAISYYTQSGGQKWDPLLASVKTCKFVWREGYSDVKQERIFCEQFEKEDAELPLELVASDDFFAHREATRFKNVVDFAAMSEFILIASKTYDDKGVYTGLKLDASIDSKAFADAQFPQNIPPEQRAYTMLESSTHSVFLHVAVSTGLDREYGTVVKSNSNGTSYVVSQEYVNSNQAGYIDFEKMPGLDGVAIINVIGNVEDVDKGKKKQKKTKITHNDGADWDFLGAPEKDSLGKKYSCDTKDLNKCSLHLHGYTERRDPRETYGSPSAVGVMIGVGNVGEFLGEYNEGDTFITYDGGVTWSEIMKKPYMWEFGDQGTVIVLVRKDEETDHVMYTTNWSEWKKYGLDKKIRAMEVTTVPSDTSRNFLLWGTAKNEEGRVMPTTLTLDFSGLYGTSQCRLDENDRSKGDFDLWEPKHPHQNENCLFGRVTQYYRRKPDLDCFVGPRVDEKRIVARNCSCTRQDFECDYNYFRAKDGHCEKVAGLPDRDPSQYCVDHPDAIEYWDVTGYRKIPISSCQEGKEFDHLASGPRPCKGKEKEFEEKHGTSGFVVFLAVVLPIGAAAGIGYYVWRNWDGKFGRIRLGDNGSSSFDSDSPFIRYPVVAVSGLVAVLAAIPLVLGSLWRSGSRVFGSGYGGRTYTSRSSFARGRGDYAVVDPDEGELLGEDSDEEV